MEVKQIAWGVSPQAARLIYMHMVHTQVRTCGKRPTQDEKRHMEAMGTMGKEKRNNNCTVGILTPKSCASTSGRTLSCLVTPGHEGSGGVM